MWLLLLSMKYDALKLHAEILSKINMHIGLQIIFSQKYLEFQKSVSLLHKYVFFQNADLFNMSYLMQLFKKDVCKRNRIFGYIML